VTQQQSAIINRVMLLTPPGAAAVAVVRLVGPHVDAFLREHFSAPVPPGRCVHGTLRRGDLVIDDPVVVRAGDATADLNLHGGPWVISAAIDLARDSGFEYVEHDPTAFDATTALEAEILASLPEARTELAIRALLAQRDAWNELRARAAQSDRQTFQDILNDRALHWLLNLPRIAIIGAANVGKSTLANQLFAQQRSITADVPGTTRDWVGEIANIDGLAVMLIDTPGQRPSADVIEQAAIARSTDQIARADLVILVLDASRPLAPEQQPLLDGSASALRVINRVDLPHAWDVDELAAAIRTVAVSGAGIGELRRAILQHFGCADLDVQQPRVWTPRQRSIIEQAARGDIAALEDF
jgi:tRNA modification GTPase